MPRQLSLDLAQRPALGREDFLIAPCNRDAIGWLDRWPEWPAQALAVYGPPASGKSHLAQVWRARSNARLIADEDADGVELGGMAGGGSVVIDDADAWRDERGLLHLINAVRESGGSLLLTAIAPPSRWPVELADLRSRLNAIASVGIGPPDDALLAAVLVKQFSDRQIRVATDVVSYVVARIERSFDAARRVAEALDGAAMAAGSGITIPLARQVLSDADVAN